MNYLQNKYNISWHYFKTLLQYRVKHKSFRMLQLLIPILDDNGVPNFYDNFVNC